MTGVELRHAVEDLRHLIELVDEAIPGGDLEVPRRPAALRAIENLYMARRTLGSIYRLILGTVDGEDEDRTEDSALLVRRLVEFLADTYWMTAADAAPDHQARRAMLNELDEHARKCRQTIDLSDDPKRTAEAEMALERTKTQISKISAQLAEDGIAVKRRPPIRDILHEQEPALAFYWSFEADVAHGGIIGRGLQRNEDFDVGAEAEPWRRAQVVQTAFSAAAEIFDRCLWLVGLSDEVRDKFVAGYRDLSSAANIATDLTSATEALD